jgi:hypothetical protein
MIKYTSKKSKEINSVYSSFIVEGVDRLGKTSLINELKQQFGFFQVMHFAKPEKLDYYVRHNYLPAYHTAANDPLKTFQYRSFENGFRLLKSPDNNLIFDRFHLGEFVYANRYRNYPGHYVFNLEYEHQVYRWNHVKLILLTTSNWSFIQDDGQSFDFFQKEAEQQDFVTAFEKSDFKHKVIIDVSNGNGGYKSTRDIFMEATGIISDQ